MTHPGLAQKISCSSISVSATLKSIRRKKKCLPKLPSKWVLQWISGNFVPLCKAFDVWSSLQGSSTWRQVHKHNTMGSHGAEKRFTSACGIFRGKRSWGTEAGFTLLSQTPFLFSLWQSFAIKYLCSLGNVTIHIHVPSGGGLSHTDAQNSPQIFFLKHAVYSQWTIYRVQDKQRERSDSHGLDC